MFFPAVRKQQRDGDYPPRPLLEWLRQAESDGLSYAVDVGDRFGRALDDGGGQERAELRALLALRPEGGEFWPVRLGGGEKN